MPHKRPREPIAPTTIPGEPLDPKIPDEDVETKGEETEEEQQARESETAFDQAVTRLPPG